MLKNLQLIAMMFSIVPMTAIIATGTITQHPVLMLLMVSNALNYLNAK